MSHKNGFLLPEVTPLEKGVSPEPRARGQESFKFFSLLRIL